MKLKVSMGVLSKTGTPWAAGTIHAVNKEGWNSPYHYNIGTLCRLLVDKRIVEISVIDENNHQFDLTDLRSRPDDTK